MSVLWTIFASIEGKGAVVRHIEGNIGSLVEKIKEKVS